MTKTRDIRVRFAPSPTGPLHMGGVRTALYNYLFARRHGGKFLIRIEDTDTARFVPGAEQYILDSLRWCGIEIDEGIGAGDGTTEKQGPHAPYRQSERRDIYIKYAQQLIETGNAYYAFDTADALETLRTEAEARGEKFSYDHTVREGLETSLRLPADEVAERIARGDQYVIRFRIPAGEDIKMNDLIRGEVTINSSTLDDKVLWKSSDGLPTYHLANIVDDHLMEISHVIRGEEWLPSLPLHYLLYRAFGWSDTQPLFAHLPLLLKPTGQGKLSKRDGDKMGFPVFPMRWISPEGDIAAGYKEDGYFPEAFVNLLALLGWNPGTEQEIFSMEELISQFSLDRVSKSGARFQPEKARWFNHEYMIRKSDAELTDAFTPILAEKGIAWERPKIERIVGLVKERATFPGDLWELSSYFFLAPTHYDDKAAAKFWKGENPARIAALKEVLAAEVRAAQADNDWTTANIDRIIHSWIEAGGHPMGQVMNSLRLAIVGESKGPGLAEICEIIGKTETLARIDNAINKLKTATAAAI
ncbi:MAG: glutamate--tRNA ligase [Alistipes sp.]|jgi:glutamyl-tRNA synthetase|nr:glutamate--tRNA ligase [Alistipes sp.]